MFRKQAWRRQLIAAILLLFGGFGLLPLQQVTAQSSTSVGPQPDGPPGLVVPHPYYHRPDSNQWLGRLVSTNSGLEVQAYGQYLNDPVNIIIYTPPRAGENSDAVQYLLRQLLLPNTNTQEPSLDNSVCDGATGWCDALHKWSPLEQGSPQLTCYNQLQLAPVNTPLDPVGFYATSPCPALGIINGESGTPPTRNHFRIYVDPQFTHVGYLSVSFEENFAWPGRCEFAAHCSLNFNLARDDLAPLLKARAQTEGWGVRSWNLPSQYTHTNLQTGPYDGVNDIRGIDGTTNPYVDGPIPHTADGIVSVICLDPANTGLCDKRPAERPMAFTELTPSVGVQLDPGLEVPFSVEVGYSDLRRSVQNVSFTLRYIDLNDVERTVVWTAKRDTPAARGRLTDVAAGRVQAEAKLRMPLDAKFDPQTGTQQVLLDIVACDNGSAPTGNPSDTACFQYKNLRYVLQAAPTRVLISTSELNSMNIEILDNLKAWLPADKYSVTTIDREPTATDLQDTALLVLYLSKTSASAQAVANFAEQGGSVLIVGEHGKYDASGARGYAAAFGIQFNRTNPRELINCFPPHRFTVPASLNTGLTQAIIPTGTSVRVAASDTLRFTPAQTSGRFVLKTASGEGLIALVNEPSAAPLDFAGRVVVTGDSNIWGCRPGRQSALLDFNENRPFHDALFDWLSHRR